MVKELHLCSCTYIFEYRHRYLDFLFAKKLLPGSADFAETVAKKDHKILSRRYLYWGGVTGGGKTQRPTVSSIGLPASSFLYFSVKNYLMKK